MLKDAGGQNRIETFAAARGQTVDAAALHARKSALFQDALDAGLPLRDGIGETITAAMDAGMKIAFVTTTSRANVDQILKATDLTRDMFDLVMDASMVSASKPDPECYDFALNHLNLGLQDVVVIEDNPDGAKAAQAAGLLPYVTPGALHRIGDFDAGVVFLDAAHIPDQKQIA